MQHEHEHEHRHLNMMQRPMGPLRAGAQEFMERARSLVLGPCAQGPRAPFFAARSEMREHQHQHNTNTSISISIIGPSCILFKGEECAQLLMYWA